MAYRDYEREVMEYERKVMEYENMKKIPCSYCGGHGKVFSCSRCGAIYCSRDCHLKHWPKHKLFCKSAWNNQRPNPQRWAALFGMPQIMQAIVNAGAGSKDACSGAKLAAKFPNADEAAKLMSYHKPPERADIYHVSTDLAVVMKDGFGDLWMTDEKELKSYVGTLPENLKFVLALPTLGPRFFACVYENKELTLHIHKGTNIHLKITFPKSMAKEYDSIFGACAVPVPNIDVRNSCVIRLGVAEAGNYYIIELTLKWDNSNNLLDVGKKGIATSKTSVEDTLQVVMRVLALPAMVGGVGEPLALCAFNNCTNTTLIILLDGRLQLFISSPELPIATVSDRDGKSDRNGLVSMYTDDGRQAVLSGMPHISMPHITARTVEWNNNVYLAISGKIGGEDVVCWAVYARGDEYVICKIQRIGEIENIDISPTLLTIAAASGGA